MVKGDLTAMAVDNVARDRQPQPNAAFVMRSGFIDFKKGLKDVFVMFGCNAAAIIIKENL
jgi:hypothetical protein